MHADILLLVLTGTVLNVVGQYLTATGFAAPSAQAMPWIRYGATLAYAGLVRARRTVHTSLSPRQHSLLTLIGFLETVAYTLFTLGFYACGPATASLLLAAVSQVLTAASSHWLLGKRLSPRQGLAVMLWGTLFLVAAAAMYTAMGVAYEALLAASGSARPSYADVSWHSSKLGFALTSAYVLVYTLPRASALLSFDQPGRTLGLVGLFAVGMNLHMACQAHVFGSRGALGVALANALRGAALTLATASLFCSPDKPWLCLSQRSALSVAVTLAGGYLWGSAAAKPAAVPEARPHKEL
ncbi:hypothetical protein F751_5512 [Auxenochlorella protothecoides]|uniref:Uncharacterized protein n=1 Tax=Auxenochlorella protothecoides TaxID=3075 RepID=A0A087STV2_AUXPR|nr:hypothetical protein F751_5512 [Auxenochlorella protothecoides]KFM29156.1 hypothetical protein F751_5512 [Auxenochlorella protothecoides]